MRQKWTSKSLKPGETIKWGVATGTLDDVASNASFDEHVFVADTKDVGVTPWLREKVEAVFLPIKNPVQITTLRVLVLYGLYLWRHSI